MFRLPFLTSCMAVMMSALLLSTPSGVVAQQTTVSQPGITVLGSGTASVPAETATIVLTVMSDVYMYDEPMMHEPAMAPVATPNADETAAPIIDALIDAGIPESDIELVVNPYAGDYGPYGGPLTVTLRFILENPSVASISAPLDAALATAQENGLYLTTMGAIYGIAECEPLLRQSRDMAIEDARQQATMQAELLDVTLGDVVASRDDPYAAIMYGTGVQTNSCTIGRTVPSMYSIYSAPPFDPTVPPQVTMTTNVELTFGIEE